MTDLLCDFPRLIGQHLSRSLYIEKFGLFSDGNGVLIMTFDFIFLTHQIRPFKVALLLLLPKEHKVRVGGTTKASLRFKQYQRNIDNFRRFIEKFSLFSNRSEALLLWCSYMFLCS